MLLEHVLFVKEWGVMRVGPCRPSVNTFFMYFYRQIPIIALFYSFKEPPLLLGVLQPNTKLRQAERLFENQLVGPESIAHIGGK